MRRHAITAGSRLPILRSSGLGIAASGVALALLCSGCIARYVRIADPGLTCVEAHRVAIEAVRRMGYTVTEATKAAPGFPGMIVAARETGTRTEGLLVRVFCTVQGAEVEAKTDQGGFAQLSINNEFRHSFEAAAANRAPPRPAAASGVDVLITPERGSELSALGLDLSAVLPVSVRITNRTARVYDFRAAGVRLQTAEGERVAPLAVADFAAHLPAEAAQSLRDKVLTDRDIAPDATLTGLLLFPLKSYTRARIELIDRASNETEGFAIEF
jgi:hypothetical protein